MNYIDPPKAVDGCVLAKRDADGHYILDLNTKAGHIALDFDPATWARLGETAKWFEATAAKQAPKRRAKAKRKRK